MANTASARKSARQSEIRRQHNASLSSAMRSAMKSVKKAVADAKIETSLSEITFIPENYITLDEKAAEQALKLVDILEDQDDIQKVHANFDISEEIMEKVAAAG